MCGVGAVQEQVEAVRRLGGADGGSAEVSRALDMPNPHLDQIMCLTRPWTS